MSRFQITSRCECQATLSAVLDAKKQVLEGWARRRGSRERAPAHSIGAQLERFDVAWLCPFCGRNTLRSFHAAALVPLPAESPHDEAPKPSDAPPRAS